jgi:hypothetical protein
MLLLMARAPSQLLRNDAVSVRGAALAPNASKREFAGITSVCTRRAPSNHE